MSDDRGEPKRPPRSGGRRRPAPASPAPDAATGRSRLWRCPRCGHRFTSRNLSHSCGNFRLSDHFNGRPRAVRQLFDLWLALARRCGPVTVYAQKTRIVLQARVRFAGAVAHRDWLETHLWLRRPVQHRCVHRIEPLGALGCAVHFRLTTADDIDDELERLMTEAYAEHRDGPAGIGRHST